MAITKNKIELLDKTISVEMEMELDYYDWWCGYYYDDDYYPHYYDYDDDHYWSYIDMSELDYVIIDTRGGIKSINRNIYYRLSPYSIGVMIDMDTIYPKHIMREKKINQLLGLEYHSKYKPTLAEYFPKNINKDEN